MKSFKEYLAEVAASHSLRAFYHFASDDSVASALLAELLNEGCQTKDLGKGRSIMFHRAHVPVGQDHIHFLVKGKKVAALNRDGTAHDKSHGYQMLQWQMDGLAKHHPGFALPKTGLIEQLTTDSTILMLIESTETVTDLVNLIERAEVATGTN